MGKMKKMSSNRICSFEFQEVQWIVASLVVRYEENVKRKKKAVIFGITLICGAIAAVFGVGAAALKLLYWVIMVANLMAAN